MPDLARLRSDFAYFAHVARGRPLADWQAHDLSVAVAFLLLLWGRQMGKSLCLALRALWRAYGGPRRVILIVSGSGELGSRRIMRETRLIANSSPILQGSTEDEQSGRLLLSNGSEIRSVAASEGSIRGWAADELLVDEAQLLSDDLLLGAALPTVSAKPNATVVLAGTASVASGAFYDMCRRAEIGEEGLRLSRRVSKLVGGDDHAPWQNPTILQTQVAAMGSVRADAEHRCLWSSGADNLISRTQLDRCVADISLPPLDQFHPPARLIGALDPGATHDRSALVALGRLPGVDPPTFVVVGSKVWAPGHPLTTGRMDEPGVVESVAALPCAFDVLIGERNGPGEAVVGRSGVLWRLLSQRPAHAGGVRPRTGVRVIHALEEDSEAERRRNAYRRHARSIGHFATTRHSVHVDQTVKSTMASALATLIQRQRLAIPASEEQLIRELLTLRVDLSPSGEERVSAPRTAAGHADLASALMLATMPVRRSTGWVSWLAELADPAKTRLPEPARRDLPTEPTVTTGAGLVLAPPPRRPVHRRARGLAPG